MAQLEGKIALITGGANGIGAATVECFAREGASVALVDLASGEKLAARIRSSGGQAVYIKADVSLESEVSAAVDSTIRAFGRLDILVNNAGVAYSGDIENTSIADWDKIIAVNLRGGFLFSKYAIPYLKKSNSASILFTGSIAGLEGVSRLTAYCASKAALINMARNLALDYARSGIRVNVVCPGATATAMLSATNIPQEIFEASLPLGKLVQPDDIASGFLYLATARAVTGHVLVIDGGKMAGDFFLNIPPDNGVM